MRFITVVFVFVALLLQTFVSTYAQQALTSANRVPLQTTPKMRNETRALVVCMENGHYSRTHLSDLDMREFIREYMQNIDIFKMFFRNRHDYALKRGKGEGVVFVLCSGIHPEIVCFFKFHF